MLVAAILGLALMQAAEAPPPAPPLPPTAVEVAPDVYLMRGAILPGRGPDGNTTIFRTARGLVVVDTGRHSWHSDAIIDFARRQQRPVSAIFNTHWHLDHSSGNGRVKAAYPRARVYTTNAIDRALSADGFLTRNLAQAHEMMAGTELNPTQREEAQIFIDTMAHSEVLRPEVVLARSGARGIGGKRLDVHLTDRAVSDADVWLYDRVSHIAVIGDLVTLPAPFFETACPAQWSAALDQVWTTPFTLAIPGHGEPMSRDQFNTYRTAFNAFIACVNTERAAGECAAIWSDGVATLEPDNTRVHEAARPYAEYYVGFLREHGGKSADCLA